MVYSHLFYLNCRTSYQEIQAYNPRESAYIQVTLQNVDSFCTPWQPNHLRMQDANLCYQEVRISAFSHLFGGQMVTASLAI